MRRPPIPSVLLLAAACGGSTAPSPAPVTFDLPDSFVVIEGTNGNPVTSEELLRRIGAADLVLLGEVHDNAAQHALRGRLLSAFAARRPAVVFEHFTESDGPIAAPGAGEAIEQWLDRTGFDRAAWKWPLHRPVVEAALASGRSLWGSHVSRDVLRPVVRDGESAAPPHLRRLLEQAPLDSASRAALDQDLIAGHCGRLPETMVVGMRAAQTVRDAAMARALMRAAESGPAWLVAGNGHVRRDIAVPRLLRAAAPATNVLAVGLLERSADGGMPSRVARGMFDLVIVTPRVARPDPCASFPR
jgi:uncharacterized iron-regulated protein